jgi:hypothetical protein
VIGRDDAVPIAVAYDTRSERALGVIAIENDRIRDTPDESASALTRAAQRQSARRKRLPRR